jgi:hypothetical protein
VALLRVYRRSLCSSNSVALLASRGYRPRALRLVLRVLSTTFVVLKSSKGSHPSRLANSSNSSSSSSSRTSATSRGHRSRCNSSSRLSLKARWVRLLFKPLVALVLRLHMLEIPLTPVRQSLKLNK